MKRLEPSFLCFDGFDENADVRARLVAPDGSEQSQRLTGGVVAWDWYFTPTLDTPLGDHRLFVEQPNSSSSSADSLTTTVPIRVERAAEPSLLQVGLATKDTIRVQLAGFPPSSRVAVFLYGPKGNDDLAFLRPLEWAVVDAGGEGFYSWSKEPADGPGLYGIWLAPTPQDCRGACATTEIE